MFDWKILSDCLIGDTFESAGGSGGSGSVVTDHLPKAEDPVPEAALSSRRQDRLSLLHGYARLPAVSLWLHAQPELVARGDRKALDEDDRIGDTF